MQPAPVPSSPLIMQSVSWIPDAPIWLLPAGCTCVTTYPFGMYSVGLGLSVAATKSALSTAAPTVFSSERELGYSFLSGKKMPKDMGTVYTLRYVQLALPVTDVVRAYCSLIQKDN
jgi:hypothetical protein